MAKFFHLPKSKKFNIKPRYYDERAELRKEREAQIKKEVEAEKAGKKINLTKEDMANYIKMARKTKKKSNIRLLIILLLLLIMFYLFFYN